jgi:excisionase family DNA binding protein
MQIIYESKTQLADRLGVSTRTISQWMAANRIPYCKPTERIVRFIPAEVDAALVKFSVNRQESRGAA